MSTRIVPRTEHIRIWPVTRQIGNQEWKSMNSSVEDLVVEPRKGSSGDTSFAKAEIGPILIPVRCETTREGFLISVFVMLYLTLEYLVDV